MPHSAISAPAASECEMGEWGIHGDGLGRQSEGLPRRGDTLGRSGVNAEWGANQIDIEGDASTFEA